MAWESKASPWDWDNAVLFHGQGTDFRKRASGNDWASEAEIGLSRGDPNKNGPLSSSASGLGSSVSSLASGSSGLPAVMANGTSGQTNFGRLNHIRFSMEDRNSGMNSGSPFSVDCNGKGDASREKRGHENANSLDGKNVGFLELRRHGSSRGIDHVNTTASDLKGDGILAVTEERGGQLSLIPSEQQQQQRRLFSDGLGHDVKEGKGAHSTEEQHSSTAGGSGGSSDSLIGLKLGKRTYFEDATGGGGSGAAAPVSAVTNPVPAKKSRATAPGVQTPRCQVEGCKTDLTAAKDYHRRHKVCEMHSKAGRVTVAGQEQRFCQQCSRFHGLTEFDEGKRSCRRRLAGHNERRRKPQPDTLALNARLPPSFQDNRRAGHIFTDRSSFLPHLRISGIPTLWDESDDFGYNHGKGAWPRMLKFEDQSSFECSLQGPGMERQLFLTGLSQHTNDRSPLLLLQSPKGMMPVSNDVAGQRIHQYLQGSVGPIGQGLTLSPSSGAGVLSGLEATPVTQGFTRVSDSGRALSLLSSQPWCSRAPVAVSLDLSTRSNMMLDQLIHDNQTPIAEPLVQGGQQHHFELTTDKLLSMASHSQSISSSTGFPGGGTNSIEKDHHVGSFMHGMSGVGNFECHPMFCMLQGHELRGSQGDSSQDVKPTIDLMRMSSSSQSQSAQPQGSSGAYQLGSSHFGELQALRSYESSIFDSQQMM